MVKKKYLVDGKYPLRDLININDLHDILEKFSLATGFTTGLIEYPSQEILISTGWRDICTNFHRVCPESAKHCKESNIYLSEELRQFKELNIKPCENGLVDGATPILIKGKYIGYIATGQVLFEMPDIERFTRQAQKYGFDTDAYLRALSKVPVVSEMQFKNALAFISEIAVTIAETALVNLNFQEKTTKLRGEIGAHKKAQKALEKSERKYKSLVNNLNIGIYRSTIGAEGVFIEANTAMVEMFGYESRDKFLKVPIRNLYKKSNDRKKISDQVIATGIIRNKELQLQRRDGSLFFCSVSTVAVKNEKGDIKYFDSIVEDITERKQIEEDYKKLQVQLAQAQKMEAIGTLAGGIAHDFNNILSGIFGYSQLTEMHIDSPDKAKVYVKNIVKGATRATELVQQILTFSRKADYEKQHLNLFVVVEDALNLIRATIPTTIEIKKKIYSKASIFADPIQMHQVIMNLCTNAYHAMSDSGGELTVKLDEKYIPHLKNESIKKMKHKYLELEVSDTGHGMDENTIEKIFNPYFTTKNRGKGTGLGLALARAIVEDHCGTIKVKSTVSKGSTFLIYLPIVEDRGNNSEKNIYKKNIPSGTESILFVDDEKGIRSFVQDFLGDYGYTVTISENGKKAYEEFKRDPQGFDIVITDMAMPKMDGDELALKILTIRKDIPVILCSGYTEKLNKKQAEEIGITRFLYKPIAGKELCFLIREVLDEKEGDRHD